MKNVGRVLVTGATGFIGSNLCKKLKYNGADVHVIALPDNTIESLCEFVPGVVVHVFDGSTDSLCKMVAEVLPDSVFHLASCFLAEHKLGQISNLMRSNLEFGTQLLEALCQSKVKTFINTGTSWEHYQNETYNPVNLYAATKHAFEAIIQYYVNVHSFRVVTLKLFDTYGTNDTRPKLMRLLKKTLVGNTPLEMSEGEQLIDLVHIDDIVDAFLIAEKHLQNSRTAGHEQFAISSGNPISLRELVGAFSKISGKELPILFGKKPYRQREVMVPWNNGRKLPGWEPKISLEKGIQAFIKGAN